MVLNMLYIFKCCVKITMLCNYCFIYKYFFLSTFVFVLSDNAVGL
jgi:hypothetical protein